MKRLIILGFILTTLGAPTIAMAAYHHEGEKDAPEFLKAYPQMASTKLDQCQLCHQGGTDSSGNQMGSCQWCHYVTEYGHKSGLGAQTTNQYGKDYLSNGRNAAACVLIQGIDSDGDGYLNITEINNVDGSVLKPTFPGDPNDYPGLLDPPQKVYTKQMLETFKQHTQFMLENANRSVDFYAEYSGVPVRAILNDAGILPTATKVTVYSPDGFAMDYSLYYTDEVSLYPVYDKTYKYPPAMYYYNAQADNAIETILGWCDYSAPSCIGRSYGDPIFVSGGLKAILALKRDGVDLDVGHLTAENKLDGEGPYRLVVPQKVIGPPDQSQKSPYQNVIWPHSYENDHNAGFSARTATIIKVYPLPEGCTDINVYEAGWDYVDQKKIIVYGSIDPSNPLPQDPDDDENPQNHISKSMCFIASSHIGGVSMTTAAVAALFLLGLGLISFRNSCANREEG